LVILLVALLIFGPSKLADLGKSLGEGLKNFKKGISSDDEAKPPAASPPQPPAVPAAPPATGSAHVAGVPVPSATAPAAQPGSTSGAAGPGDPNRSPPAPSGSG